MDALDEAIARGDLKRVDELMAAAVLPRVGSLLFAISERKNDIVKRLVQDSPIFDQLEPYWKQTPLERAVECKNQEAVEILLKKGASPNKAGRFGPPLFVAIRKNFIPAAKLLIAAGAQLEHRVPPAEFTPLISAAQMGQVEMIHLLLAAGANPLAVDTLGRSAFQIATDEGELAAADLLAALSQSPPRVIEKSSIDALNDAIRRKDTTAVNECLAAGAHPSKRDKWGWNPLGRAVEAGSLDIARKLVRAGADVNSHRKGITPPWTAVSGTLKGGE